MGISSADVERILNIPGGSPSTVQGIAGAEGASWLRYNAQSLSGANLWDSAHDILGRGSGNALSGETDVLAIEPDTEQQWNLGIPGDTPGMAAGSGPVCVFQDQDPSGGKATVSGVAWQTGVGYSQTAAARGKVGNSQSQITIAHLDTGYDPNHRTLPSQLDKARQRNFVDDGRPKDDATDHAPAGSSFANHGHGTGTLSLLAGNRLDGSSPGWKGFKDYVGAAPLAGVIPVRIADWVVRFTTSTMVKGFDYARQQGAQVLSMSMGGVTSAALTDAVNLAYDSGLVMVTAAGNNFAGYPSPKSIVFPARYRRVLAACGVMGDGRAYAGLKTGTMQGNYGPSSKMKTALGAYTPNVPWAQIDCPDIVDMDGAGTSAATPQIAAAVALWLAQHWDVVKAYPEPWMRIEAVRYALFSAAQKVTPKMGAAETLEKIGQGVLLAEDALAVNPLAAARLSKLAPDTATWSWLDLALGTNAGFATVGDRRRATMFALELTQLAHMNAAVDAAIADPDADPAGISAAARNRYLEAALAAGPSKALRAFLEQRLGGDVQVPVSTPPSEPPQAVVRKPRERRPPRRRLRIYALDPSIAKQFDTVAVHEATVSVPWDDQPETSAALLPGPIGEYLEVIDVDPASDRVYDPVDLNDKKLLAQDGLSPSEGNPQFHQQMVYAVAMMTIGNFERALGRRALWSPHMGEGKNRAGETVPKATEVHRLRLYPHALRTQNAYYSPDKKAILFGYFPAESGDRDATVAGTTVFSCLSADIIAHEMSHALLDGLHRRFQEASNPDVLAFHEAFADIIALFQHFTLKEVVSFVIAQARGKVAGTSLLSGLARQFGEGAGRSGPLRDYAKASELDYDKTFEPHDRGSILVFAVYEAFLTIVQQRTEDLIHLATGGSGELPAGSLHPRLVERLAAETTKTAQHVLTMCIRALDYCPAVDITFGEYFRALISADVDAFPEDPLQYRVAFLQSFKKWKLLPRNVRTVSEETLIWATLENPAPEWLHGLLGAIELNWDRKLSRSEIFKLNEKNRWKMWSALKRVFARDPKIYAQFGLLPDLPRYRNDMTLLKEAEKGESTFEVFNVRPTRRVEPDGSFRTEVVVIIHQRQPVDLEGNVVRQGMPPSPEGEARRDAFWFRGGATVIIDPRKGHEEIRYSIIKNSGSESRRKRQAEFMTRGSSSALSALYFGQSVEPFAVMHSENGDDRLA